MKRWGPFAIVATMVLTTAGACQPPPPSGWQPPVIADLWVSSDPVTPGVPFTVSAIATDDKQVAQVSVQLYEPGNRPALSGECQIADFDPQPYVEIDITCVLKEWALNGNWRVSVSAFDGEHSLPGTGTSRTFDVTGGTPDLDPPVLEFTSVTPASPTAAEAFELAFGVSDERLLLPQPVRTMRVYDTDQPNRSWTCLEKSRTEVSPTTLEMEFTCPAMETGPRTARYIQSDLNYNRVHVDFAFDVVDGP